jgi:hypothetical protein
VDLATATEATAAIAELSGQEILQRKVSVQLARKPEPAEAKAEGAASGGEGASGNEGRKRTSGRTRGRGRGRGRVGRGTRGSRSVCHLTPSPPAKHLLTPMNCTRPLRPRPLKSSLLLPLARLLLFLRLPTRMMSFLPPRLVKPPASPVSVPRSSADLPRMVFLPRPRLWWPTCRTI